MFKVIALCALCACSFSQVTYADNPIKCIEIEISAFGGTITLRANFAKKRDDLPNGFALCKDRVLYEGEWYCVYNDECGDGDGYLRKCDEPDAPFIPFQVIDEQDSVRPPVASASDDHGGQETIQFEAEASVSYNPLTDTAVIVMTLPISVPADLLPRPSKQSGVSIGVLGHVTQGNVRFAGGLDDGSLIAAGSIVRIHGGAEVVMAYLVNHVGVREVIARTTNPDIVFGISADYGLNGTYYVWLQTAASDGERVILRSFSIPTKGGHP